MLTKARSRETLLCVSEIHGDRKLSDYKNKAYDFRVNDQYNSVIYELDTYDN